MRADSRTFVALLLAGVLLVGCSEDKRLAIEMVVAKNINDISKLEVLIGGEQRTVEPGDDLSFGASASMEEGKTIRVAVKGYEGASFRGFGATPLFHAVDAPFPLRLYFAPPESVSDLPDVSIPGFLEAGGITPLVDGRVDDPDALGGIWGFGGYDATDRAVSSWYFDPYLLTVYELPALPTAVAHPYVIPVDPTMALIFGGITPDGTPSDAIYLYSSTCGCSSPYYTMEFGNDTLTPSYGGALVRLGPYDGVMAGNLMLTDAYILAGGTTADGLDERLHLIAVYYDISTTNYHIEAVTFGWTNPMGHVAGASFGDGSSRDVVLAGDGGVDQLRVTVHPDGSAFEWTLDDVNHDDGVWFTSGTVFAVGDDTAFVIGSQQGECVMEGYYYSVTSESLDAEPLDEGVCAPYASQRMGEYALVLGDGALYVMVVDDSNNRVTLRTSFDIPNTGACLAPLPTGAVAVLGGHTEDGTALEGVTIFNPDPDRVGLTMEVEDE